MKEPVQVIIQDRYLYRSAIAALLPRRSSP